MADDKAEYLKGREKFESERATRDVKVPSGKVFKVVRLESLELIDAWRHLGIDPNEITSLNLNSIGTRMLANSQRVLDEFVVRFVRAPVLLPSTAPAEEQKKHLVTTDLAAADKMALITGLLTSSSGEEGKATAESFPAPAVREDTGCPGQAIP